MKLVEDRMPRNVTIFIIVVDQCIIIIHEVVTSDSTLQVMKHTVFNSDDLILIGL